MKLDDAQKADFMQYYGNCPLQTKDGLIVSVEGIEVRSDGTQELYGRKYVPEYLPSLNGTLVPMVNRYGMATIHSLGWNDVGFENIEPYFVEPGFYQQTVENIVWITKKPERSIIKGQSRHNTSMIGIHSFNDKMKELMMNYKEFDFNTVVRIFHKSLPSHKTNLDEVLQKYSNEGKNDYGVALSKNVALVSHKTYEIPVVLYKLNPVGYYCDGRVLVNKDKSVSIETIQEETGLPTEIYES